MKADDMITSLVDDLKPVRALQRRIGVALVGFAFAATLTAVLILAGPAAPVMAGDSSMLFLSTNGLLLVLGIATSIGAIAMASPRVGNHYEGQRWVIGMASILPLAALFLLIGEGAHWHEALGIKAGWHCALQGLLCSGLTAFTLIMWLRRGAPVDPNFAGLLVGVGAAALGSVAYGISCPYDGVYHLGLRHNVPVIVGAVIGRFVISRILRW